MLEQDAVVEAVWKERIPLGLTRSNARAGQPVVTAIKERIPLGALWLTYILRGLWFTY